MMERTGQVSTVTSKDFQNIELWSFQLEGSRRFYRTGKDEPNIEVGQWIKFQDRNGIVMLESLEQVENGVATEEYVDSAPSEPPAVPASTPGAVGKRLQYQAARADACRLVVAALHTDHLPHASNVAKGKRLDLLLGYISDVTKQLLEQEEAA
jgi:hypothetical protein